MPLPATAHPRSHGGNGLSVPPGTRVEGPSPLARGKLRDGVLDPVRFGPIPARTGETGQRRPAQPSPRAHPRSHGGNMAFGYARIGQGGPSPLARGKRVHPPSRQRRVRPIPARTGETARPASSMSGDAGPSPLARGKPRQAGRLPPRRRAHPRSHGGNTSSQAIRQRQAGPSPLARGKRIELPDAPGHYGPIPARTGETFRRCSNNRKPGAHPRSHGGNVHTRAQVRIHVGPSPLARGKLGRAGPGVAGIGPIPARTGETL